MLMFYYHNHYRVYTAYARLAFDFIYIYKALSSAGGIRRPLRLLRKEK